jgi:HEPN domain-containing protein
MFVKLQATDEREVANTLVEVAGLRRLSQLLEERRLVDENQEEVTDSPMKQLVEGMVRSSNFSQALRAVMLHNSQQNKRTTKLTVSELTRELAGIRFRPVAGELRSALFYKKVAGVQAKEEAITDSAQVLGAYYDESQQIVFIGNPTDVSEDSFTAELALALRRAVPDLGQVDSFLMEAMMRSALKDGVDGITGFLEKRDIKVVALKSGQLGPGDTLPPELHDHLNWTMDSTFAEGESVTIMVKDKFIIGEIARWPEGSKQGEGLNRSYLVRVSQELFETRKHFEVYKIQANSQPKVSSTEARRRDSMDLVPVDGQEVRDMTDTSGKLTDDSKHIIEVKAYLREMSKMPPEDYKLVMRRLFKTWHPDKVGDTPVANKVFLLLRRHENWFKRRQAGENVGDDSWLEKEDADQEDTGKGPILPLPGRQYEKQEGTMGSWFDEFQREMEQSALAKTAKAKTKAEPKDIEAPRANLVGDSSHWQQYERTDGHMFGNRIIDRTQAPKWLQQARLEFVAAKRLICPAGDLRSLPSASVWHSQQVVEMAVKSAMLRTCGVAEDEVTGGAAHDVECFIRRLVATAVNTEEQRRAQLVPGTDADIMWLKASYLGARYPRDSRDGIPGLKYTAGDADRALALAEAFLIWAAHVEDLPDPNKLAVREAPVGEGRWTAVQEELEAASGNVKVMPDKNLTDLKPGDPNGAPTSLGPGSSEGKRKADDHVEDQSVKKARRWNKK